MPTYYEHLEFDLQNALLRQLVTLFDGMPSVSLTKEAVQAIPAEAQGVYQLFIGEKMMYVGKSDNEAGLQKRLLRHVEKITSRRNLDPSQVCFKAVRVYVFTVIDVEQQLIRHYQGQSHGLSWNNSGFGANDPGRERDTTKLKSGHFDKMHPIDVDLPISMESAGQEILVVDALRLIKNHLPYTVRFETVKKKPHKDLQETTVKIVKSPDTVRSILKQISAVLGSEWQLTILPGYVILYKEAKPYPEGEVIR